MTKKDIYILFNYLIRRILLFYRVLDILTICWNFFDRSIDRSIYESIDRSIKQRSFTYADIRISNFLLQSQDNFPLTSKLISNFEQKKNIIKLNNLID